MVIAKTVDVPKPGTTILEPISDEKYPVCNVILLAVSVESPIDDTYILLLGTNWPPVDVINIQFVDTGASNVVSKKVLFAVSSLYVRMMSGPELIP